MTYGIKIKNNKSEIQIDDSYVNYVFNGQEDSVTLNGTSSIALTNPSKYPPIILIRPTDSNNDRGCGVFDYTYSSPNYTHFRIFGGKLATGSDTCDFDYRVYTISDTISSDVYGLRIKRSDGRIVYDCGQRPFKIVEVGNPTVGTTYTHSSHSNPWYIFSPWLSGIIGIYTPPQGPVYRLVMGLAKQSSTSVKGIWIVAQLLGLTNLNFTSYQDTTFNLLICDI